MKNKVVYLLESNSFNTEAIEEIQLEEIAVPGINEQVEEWKAKIIDVIENEKMYENPVLTLSDVAQRLSTNQTVVSKMVNQGFSMNFNDLVNTYRVKAVIEMLQQEVYKQQTLLAISIDCGFNSKTTFNRCFKKITGMSPKEFIQQQTLNNSKRK